MIRRSRLVSQIIKELLSVLRDPKSRMVLIGPPIMQLFLFAFAVTLEVQNIGIAVLDQDAGRWSHEFTARLSSAQMVDRVIPVHSLEQLGALVDRREAIAGVHFAPDFSRRVASGEGAAAQVILDGRRANAAQISLGYMNSIAAALNEELSPAAAGQPVTTVVRHWFNPNLEYRWFVVPGLVGILSMVSALLVTALSIARERELGTFEQLLVSPALPLEIIIGKCVPALLIGLTLGSVMIAAGVWIFSIPFTGSILLLYAGLLLFILSVVGLGLMISSVSQTQQQAILGTFAAAVPLVLLSGFATPVENMPTLLQWLAQANPLKHFLIIVQGSFMKSLPADAIWASAWPMLVIALVTLVSAFGFVQRRLQ